MNWFDASVLTRRVVAGTVHVRLGAPAQVTGSFKAPGQYLHVRVGARSGPFAPASAPHEPLELLFKPGSPVTDALAALEIGAKLEVTAATGPGFPLDKAKGHALLLVASGTGQAPMRSVIECVRRRRGEFGPVTLLLGVKDSAHLAFSEEHALWQHEGIEVHATLSQADAGWSGRQGRVQLHLPEGSFAKTVAFLVGQREMVEEVMGELKRRGLPAEQIFLNV